MNEHDENPNFLITWIKEIEQTYKMDGFYRCFTDENHGIYFDLYPEHEQNLAYAITNDDNILIDDGNYISGLLADFKHGES